MQPITTEELKTLLAGSDGKLTLINTLSPEQFTETKIPGSQNIPQASDDFVQRVAAAAGSKNQPVVVYCASQQCDSSTQAAKKLDAASFVTVYDYEAGAKGWQEAGNALAVPA